MAVAKYSPKNQSQTITCKVCSSDFWYQARAGIIPVYCSDDCRNKFNRSKAKLLGSQRCNKSCEYCKVSFEAATKKTRFCSNRCAAKQRKIEGYKSPSTGKVSRPVGVSAACSICCVEKDPDQFYIETTKSGARRLQASCKDCKKNTAKNRKKQINSDPLKRKLYLEQRSKYNSENKDSIRERNQLRHNKAKALKALQPLNRSLSRKFLDDRQQCLDQGRLNKLEAWRDWLSIAPDCWLSKYYSEIMKPWHDHRISPSEKVRLKRKLCPEFAIYDRMRSAARKQAKDGNVAEAMRCAIKKGHGSNKVERICGYSVDQLKTHIENSFTQGMSWQLFNEGKIHIDHIIPKSVFDCELTEELVDCWSLENLQPLWAEDNLKKRDKAVAELSDPVLWMKYGARVKSVESAREAAWAA